MPAYGCLVEEVWWHHMGGWLRESGSIILMVGSESLVAAYGW